MTKKEVLKLFALIASIYTQAGRFAEADAQMRDAWHALLEDIPFGAAERAVSAHAVNNTFPPSIAEIRRYALAGISDRRDTAEEAWALVLKALKNSAYNSAEEFAKLPDICKRCVGSAQVLKSWAISEDVTTVSVARAQFLNAYRVMDSRERERAMMPPSIRDALDEAMKHNLLQEGGYA